MSFRIYFMIVFSTILLGLSGQTTDKMNLPLNENSFKPKYHLQFGSSLLFSPAFGSTMNLYANPSFQVPLSKRFSAEAGIIASTSFLPGSYAGESDPFHGKYNSFAIYGTALYQAAPNLTIYGTGIRQLMKTYPQIPVYGYPQNSFTLGTNLKVSHNITIGASVHFSDSYHNYLPFPGSYQRGFFPSYAW